MNRVHAALMSLWMNGHRIDLPTDDVERVTLDVAAFFRRLLAGG